MNPWIVFAIILLVALAILGFLYYKGSKLQKEQQEQKEQLFSAATPVTMLVIDKKRLPLKESGLPQIVIDQTPKRARRAKVPVVKAKIGPKVTSLIADENVYDLIPVKAEIKAMISGIYITSVKNVRGKKAPEPAKKSFSQKLRAKQKKYEQTYEQETASMKLSKEEKAARKAKAKEEKERAKKIQ